MSAGGQVDARGFRRGGQWGWVAPAGGVWTVPRMPTPRDTTLTLDELYNSYTPVSLTDAEWRTLAPDLRGLVRATNPSGYWRARDLLSTACRFVKLVSPAGDLLTVAQAFSFANVERHRSLAAAAGATPNSLQNERGRLNTMLKVQLGFQAPAAEGLARVEPLADDVYEALKAEAQAAVATTLLGRSLLNATTAVLKRRPPRTSPRSLRTSWVLEVLGAPGSFADIVRSERLIHNDFQLACPHLVDLAVDITRLRDGL